MSETGKIKALLRKLVNAALQKFPKPRQILEAPKEPGVYVIYSPSRRVLHVGSTPRGRGGLHQRLCNHLHAKSSFTKKYLSGDGSALRDGYKFRYLVVDDPRRRALLEALAIGTYVPLISAFIK